MITVRIFQVSQDLTKLSVSLETTTGNTINDIKLWTEGTFKDYGSAVSLNSKLTGTSNVEVFDIVPSDLGVSQLNGIYFAEISSTGSSTSGCTNCEGNPTLAVSVNFYQFYYCINTILCNLVPDCTDCDYNLTNALSADLYLEAMKSALIIGRFNDAILHYNALRKICTTGCDACDTSSLSGPIGFGVLDGNFLLS